MTSFSRFQKKNQNRKAANNLINTKFIFNSYPSITITNEDKKIQAVVVNNQKQNYVYIYTTIDDNLDIGSTWQAKGLNLLVTEEVVMIKDVNWHKYHSLLCNVQIGTTWGYFKGPEESFINVKLENKTAWESSQKPVLVLPSQSLNFRDKIIINGRAWIVQEFDSISTPGIVYYSLTSSTIGKDEINQTYIEKGETFFSDELINFNDKIVLTTEDGYFKTNKNLIIYKRTETEIIFSIPFGLNEVTVEVKQGGQIVTKLYKVV